MYKVSKREVLFDTSGKSTCLATYKLAVVTVIIRHARKLVLSSASANVRKLLLKVA